MLTSEISMPSRASWLLSRLQKAHHVVVYMVSGCAIGCSPSACRYELHITNTSELQVLPSRTGPRGNRAALPAYGEHPEGSAGRPALPLTAIGRHAAPRHKRWPSTGSS